MSGGKKKSGFKLFDALELQERVVALERISSNAAGIDREKLVALVLEHEQRVHKLEQEMLVPAFSFSALQERVTRLEAPNAFEAALGLHEIRIATLEAQLTQAIDMLEQLQQRQLQLLGDVQRMVNASLTRLEALEHQPHNQWVPDEPLSIHGTQQGPAA